MMDRTRESAPRLAGTAGGEEQHHGSGPMLVSTSEACALLGLGARTIWSLTTRNAIPHRRVGRRVLFSPDELRAWVAANCPTAPGSAERVRKALRAGGAR
jgi:excisionase family DNA binding protein